MDVFIAILLIIIIIVLLVLCGYLSDLIIKKNKIIDSLNADNQCLQQNNFEINHKYNNLILERKLKKINYNTFEIKKIVRERIIYDREKVSPDAYPYVINRLKKGILAGLEDYIICENEKCIDAPCEKVRAILYVAVEKNKQVIYEE